MFRPNLVHHPVVPRGRPESSAEGRPGQPATCASKSWLLWIAKTTTARPTRDRLQNPHANAAKQSWTACWLMLAMGEANSERCPACGSTVRRRGHMPNTASVQLEDVHCPKNPGPQTHNSFWMALEGPDAMEGYRILWVRRLDPRSNMPSSIPQRPPPASPEPLQKHRGRSIEAKRFGDGFWAVVPAANRPTWFVRPNNGSMGAWICIGNGKSPQAKPGWHGDRSVSWLLISKSP